MVNISGRVESDPDLVYNVEITIDSESSWDEITLTSKHSESKKNSCSSKSLELSITLSEIDERNLYDFLHYRQTKKQND